MPYPYGAVTLLSNGLDFIDSALENFSRTPDPRAMKYGVLHLCSGIKLVMKEHLRKEGWTLVFARPEKADERAYRKGEFNSATFDQCVDRLVASCGVTVEDWDREDLLSFRRMRNRIEHFAVMDSPEAIISSSTFAVSFVVDLIAEEFESDDLDADSHRLLDDIRRRLSEFQDFVRHRTHDVQARLSGETPPVVTCPDCRQPFSVVEVGAKCAFCGYRRPPEEAFDDYEIGVAGRSSPDAGNPWPRTRCPECYSETLALTRERGSGWGHGRYVCFTCGRAWSDMQLEHCATCDELMETGGMTVCSACFDEVLRKDD